MTASSQLFQSASLPLALLNPFLLAVLAGVAIAVGVVRLPNAL